MTAPADALPAVAAQVRELQSLMRAASAALAADPRPGPALTLLALAQRDAEALAAMLDAAQQAA
jgi:hypothetical protein